MDNFSFYDNLQYKNYSINTHEEGDNKVRLVTLVVTYIITAIGFPLILAAIYSLYSMVRNDNVAPIYVINLLISDLIQLCCMIFREALYDGIEINYIIHCIHHFGVMGSVCFIVCVALERYLVVAHPLWYRFRRTIKISVVVCVFCWALPLVDIISSHFWLSVTVQQSILSVYFLLPLPLLIFFLGGTLKAMSSTRSVHRDEKRRIVGILVLALLIYMLLFLPNTILTTLDALSIEYHKPLGTMSFLLVLLSPLADLTLYIFMRKGAVDKLLTSLCCFVMDSNEDNSSSV